MDAKARTRYTARAQVIKAMAHPSRLLIIDELSRRPRCVCELTAMVGADTSTVSKHLAILRNAGIVNDEKRGTMVYYRLRVPCILNFFGCVEAVLKTAAKDRLTAVA